MPALMTVVDARKYSRNSGAISAESDTEASGKTSSRSSRTRRPCVGLTLAWGRGGGREPLRYAEAEVSRDERLRLGEMDVVERRARLALYLEQVAKPFRRDE